MARYQYAGPGPVPDPEGEIVHPGDEREFAEEPAYGPWELLDGPDTPAPAADPAPSSDRIDIRNLPPLTPKEF